VKENKGIVNGLVPPKINHIELAIGSTYEEQPGERIGIPLRRLWKNG
jgi:hypothetical protein